LRGAVDRVRRRRVVEWAGRWRRLASSEAQEVAVVVLVGRDARRDPHRGPATPRALDYDVDAATGAASHRALRRLEARQPHQTCRRIERHVFAFVLIAELAHPLEALARL